MRQDPVTIDKIAVRGFKSIGDEQAIALRPLTLLAGANSSGKSSMMQPLLLMKQTLEAQYDPPSAFRLDGPNVCFTRTDQILTRAGAESSANEFGIKMEMSNGTRVEEVFNQGERLGFDVASVTLSDAKGNVTRMTPDMSHDEIMNTLPARSMELIESFRKIYKTTNTEHKLSINRNRCFLYYAAQTSEGISPSPLLYGPLFQPSVYIYLYAQLKRMIHLPGFRGQPHRTYPFTSSNADSPVGTFENYVASIIVNWQKNRDELSDNLNSALEEIGLISKIQAQMVDDTQIELQVGLHEADHLFNIADVGFGVSQSLPVIVALIAAEPGQIVYLEEPEIHLHPLAQRKMARLIANAGKRGVIVVAETHSALLLKEIQTLVAGKELPQEKVLLHWFQLDDKGHTKVSSTELDEDGAFGDWPVDFDEIELRAENDYLDAVEKRHAYA